MTALDRLLDRVGDPLDASKPRPLVTLEEFFTDNDDVESLGPYARCRFGPTEFYAALVGFRDVTGIHDVRIEIAPEISPSGWPRADTVWVVSKFDRRELPRQITPEFWDGFLPVDWLSYPRFDGVPIEPLNIPDGAFVSGFDYS